MPELTPKLGIKKPLGNETVSRAVFNENWDIIDRNAAAQSDLNNVLAEIVTARGSKTTLDERLDVSLKEDGSLKDNVVTDAAIGNRTVDQTQAPVGATGTLTQILSWLANRIKAIMDTPNWWETPVATLVTLWNKFNEITGHKHTGAAGDGPKIDPSAFNTANWSAFRAYQSTAQSLAVSTWTKVAFQTEEYDQKSEYDPTTYRFTAAASGLYLFTVGAGWPALTSGNEYSLRLFKNGFEAIFLETSFIGASNAPRSVRSALLKLNAGDYVEVYIISISAGNMQIGSSTTFFAGIRIA